MKKWCAAVFLSIGMLLRAPVVEATLQPEQDVYCVRDLHSACEYLLERAITCQKEIWLRLDEGVLDTAARDKLFYLLPTYRIAELKVYVVGNMYKLVPAYKSCVRMLNSVRGNVTVQLSEQEQAALAEAKRVLNELQVEGKSHAEIALALHDWIVKNSAYDLPNAHFNRKYAEGEYSPFDGKYLLLEHKGVCDSYVQAYWLMLQMSGVPCSMMSGHMREDGQGHAWNLVLMDDHWAHVDTTFDDPVPDQPGVVKHTYFDKSDADMEQGRMWDKSIFPSAQGQGLMSGRLLEFATVEELMAYLRRQTSECAMTVQVAELAGKADAESLLRKAALQAGLPGVVSAGQDPIYPRALRVRYRVGPMLTGLECSPEGAATKAPEQ